MRRIGLVLVAAGASMATSATTSTLATAFLITGDGGPPAIGAGVAITHVFLQCGNGGNSPSANFAWAESP
jgi:hypothetical protein